VNLVTTDRRSGVTLPLAFVVSTVGDWIYRLAIPTLIRTITGSALARADPLHARRMCAALLAVGAPALLRRDAAAGRGERDRTRPSRLFRRRPGVPPPQPDQAHHVIHRRLTVQPWHP
jgi:hypothetical protein